MLRREWSLLSCVHCCVGSRGGQSAAALGRLWAAIEACLGLSKHLFILSLSRSVCPAKMKLRIYKIDQNLLSWEHDCQLPAACAFGECVLNPSSLIEGNEQSHGEKIYILNHVGLKICRYCRNTAAFLAFIKVEECKQRSLRKREKWKIGLEVTWGEHLVQSPAQNGSNDQGTSDAW